MQRFYTTFVTVTYPILIVAVVILFLSKGNIGTVGLAAEGKTDVIQPEKTTSSDITAGTITADKITTGNITARSLTIVDDKRAVIESSSLENKGMAKAVIGVVGDKPSLCLSDKDGNPHVVGLWLYDKDGKCRAMLSVFESGPGLNLFDKDGKVIWSAP